MDTESVKVKMQEVLAIVSADISSIRSGKATPSMVSELRVAVYGGNQKLRVQELASVSAPDAESIVIDPWDKSIAGEIKKGIEVANIGLNPQIDGEIIRINIPPLTSEDREKLTRLLSQKLELGRVMLRQVRAEDMRSIKNAYEEKRITEDEKFEFEKKLQEITDEHVGKIESLGETKKSGLLAI